MLVERFDGDTVQAARDHLVTRGHLSASGSLTESFRKAIQPVSPGCPSLLELHSFLAFLEAPRMRYSHGSPSLRSCRAGYTSRPGTPASGDTVYELGNRLQKYSSQEDVVIDHMEALEVRSCGLRQNNQMLPACCVAMKGQLCLCSHRSEARLPAWAGS